MGAVLGRRKKRKVDLAPADWSGQGAAPPGWEDLPGGKQEQQRRKGGGRKVGVAPAGWSGDGGPLRPHTLVQAMVA